NPDRRLADELVPVLRFSEHVFQLVLQGLAADAIGVMRFVVEDEDVLLAADFTPEDPVDEGGITLDVTQGLDLDLAQVALPVAVLFEHGEEPGGELTIQLLLREVAPATRGRRPGAD